MYIHLIRNQPQGTAITGRLVINGRFFCNTLERVGYEIPALCYPVRVTMSPRFKRLLPIVQNVPGRSGIRFHRGTKPQHSTGCILVVADNKNDNTDNLRGNQLPAALKENIPFRSRDIDSSGCLLVVGDNKNDNTDNLRPNQYSLGAHGECSSPLAGILIASGTLSPLSLNKPNIGCRSVAEVENQLTQLLLQTQNDHETVILEVIDFRPGTEYGYNTPCPIEIQKR